MKIDVLELVEALKRAYEACEEYLEENELNYCEYCPVLTVNYPFTLDKIKNLNFPCNLNIDDLLILREWCNERCHLDKNLDLACRCPAGKTFKSNRKCIARRCPPIFYDEVFGIEINDEEFIFNLAEAKQALSSSNNQTVTEFKNPEVFNDED